MSNNTESRTWNIDQIRAISEDEAKRLSSEHMTIKDHDVYFIDFPDSGFGYSAVVFADGRHIYYANDYQLHHPSMTREELRKWYIEVMNNKLFTEAEICEPISSYEDFKRKSYFLSNYYGMRRDYISVFFIGSDEERKARKKQIEDADMIYCSVSLAYYDKSEMDFVKHLGELDKKLHERREETENNYSFLKSAFLREMWNHEYIINYQGNWDVLRCFGSIVYNEADDYEDYFNQLKFDGVHRKAFLDARKEYLKKAEEMEQL